MLNEDKSQILTEGASVEYKRLLFTNEESDLFLQKLIDTIEWKSDEAIIFGKKIITRRKAAWYADEPFEYTYSRVTKKALPWTSDLLKIKKTVENYSNEKFNSCLLNLYHDGDDGMSWHSDSEKELKKHGMIASVSFGSERKFCFKHKKTKEKHCLMLEHGSALLMSGETQDNWLHQLPKTKKSDSLRINLTFRQMQV